MVLGQRRLAERQREGEMEKGWSGEMERREVEREVGRGERRERKKLG